MVQPRVARCGNNYADQEQGDVRDSLPMQISHPRARTSRHSMRAGAGSRAVLVDEHPGNAATADSVPKSARVSGRHLPEVGLQHDESSSLPASASSVSPHRPAARRPLRVGDARRTSARCRPSGIYSQHTHSPRPHRCGHQRNRLKGEHHATPALSRYLVARTSRHGALTIARQPMELRTSARLEQDRRPEATPALL